MGTSAAQHRPPGRARTSLGARHVDRGDVWALELSGEADVATLEMLRDELAQGVRTNRARVVIDVSGLRFCDVASADLISSVCRSPSVSLTGVAGSVKLVLDLLASEVEPSLPPSSAPTGPTWPDSSQRTTVRAPPAEA